MSAIHQPEALQAAVISAPEAAAPTAGAAESHPKSYGWTWHRDVPQSVRGRHGMIASTRGGKALDDGLALLKSGGTAIDAGLSIALAQVVHAAGSWVSAAGLMTLVYYEAASGRISSMNAGFNTVKGELDPLSIPMSSLLDPTKPDLVTSGRAALVPGFFAGLRDAHQRFGRLPFARLFDSAIAMADDGVEVDADFAGYLLSNRAHFSRLPETKAIFTKPDGGFYDFGDVFRQPAIAGLLRSVAAEGVDHIYRGPWARKLIAGLQADGGKMTLEDLADYEVEWSEPIHMNYKGHDVYSLHQAHFFQGMLGLAQAGDLAAMGRYYESPETFYWYHKIFRATGTNMAMMGEQINNLAVPATDWLEPAKVQEYWRQIQAGTFPAGPRSGKEHHSDGMVIVDSYGNVASLLHSTNTGGIGLFVDGISIPGVAANQQEGIKKIGPGRKLPNFIPNSIVLKAGKPYIATVATGYALHQETVKVLTNIIDYGKAAREAVEAASFIEPHFDLHGHDPGETVLTADYPSELLDAVRAKGMPIEEIMGVKSRLCDGITAQALKTDVDTLRRNNAASLTGAGRVAGYGAVVPVLIDPDTGECEGVSARWSGAVVGY
jgi:gamma-glutamyltranspeptidase/glutathione hydrolase